MVTERLAAAAILLLLTVAAAGCSSGDDDDGGEASETAGGEVAKAEAERAGRIKTHIDTSDVVKAFPPSIVKDGDVAAQEKGTPARALLEWWQAFQFHDVATVKALTSRSTIRAVGPAKLTQLVRLKGLQGIQVLGTTEQGSSASVQAGLLAFAPSKPGGRLPSTPTGSKPATFAMQKEGEGWVFAQTDYLELKLNSLPK